MTKGMDALEWAVAAYNTDVFSSDKEHVKHIISTYLTHAKPSGSAVEAVKVKPLDDDQIMEIIKEVAPWKTEPQLNDLLTYEKSVPLFPQATYDVPSYRAEKFVRAIEARISALHPASEAQGDVAGYLFRLRYGEDRWSQQLMFSDTLPKEGDYKDVEPLFRKSASETHGGSVLNEIAKERRRQIEKEGWTPEHDDAHIKGEMASAAAVYALCAAANPADRAVMGEHGTYNSVPFRIRGRWPWDESWLKPMTRRRDLVKAGALIVAEIERLDRAAAPSQKGPVNE